MWKLILVIIALLLQSVAQGMVPTTSAGPGDTESNLKICGFDDLEMEVQAPLDPGNKEPKGWVDGEVFLLYRDNNNVVQPGCRPMQ